MSRAGTSPRIWRVLGDKRGDNAQVEVIADALERARGWPSELRHLEMLPKYVQGKPRVGPTLHHIDQARSDKLEPPWPDLILTRGRRPSNAALWIKAQSGGRTRIVLLGKPAGWLTHYMSWFDLVITSSETLPAPFDNVMQIDLPLMQVSPDRLAAGRAEWEGTLAPLPRPIVAVLIGGPTSPYVYNAETVASLRARIARTVLADGGTPWLVGSRRTPPGFLDGCGAALTTGCASSTGLAPRGATPIPACWRWPTGSSSPATASRCRSRSPGWANRWRSCRCRSAGWGARTMRAGASPPGCFSHRAMTAPPSAPAWRRRAGSIICG